MHIDTDEQSENRLAQLVKRVVAGEEITKNRAAVDSGRE